MGLLLDSIERMREFADKVGDGWEEMWDALDSDDREKVMNDELPDGD